MGELPSGRVVLRQAVVAPSVIGAVALFGVSPGTGLIVGGLTLGAALGVGWSAPRGRLISAISLFVIAALGAFMTFAIGLGWADSAGPFEGPPYGALNLPFASFFVALPASIALAIDQALRSDDGRGSPRAVAVADAGARPEGRRRQAILIPVGILAIPLTIGAYVGYGSAYPWTAPGGLEEVGRVLVREPTLALFIALGTGALVVIVARATKGARDGRLVRLALGSAGLVGLGALGGFVLTPVLGVPYVAPVMAFGSASARLDGQPTYTPDVSGYTECESVAGTAVSRVWAEVGSLQLEERQAFLILDNDGPDLFLSRPGSKYARFDVVFFKDHRGYIARAGRGGEPLAGGVVGRAHVDVRQVARLERVSGDA